MGMFDIVKDVLFCPYCGHKQEECDFQTKSFVKMMCSFELKDINEKFIFYSTCRKCDKNINLIHDPLNNSKIRIHDLQLKEKKVINKNEIYRNTRRNVEKSNE